DDPVLISMIFAVQVEKVAAKNLERVVTLHRPTASDLARLTLDDKVSYRRQFHRACQMEESGFGISCFTLLDGGPARGLGWLGESIDPWGLAVLDSSFYRVFFLQADLAGYRRQMKKVQDLAQRPYHESDKGWTDYNQSLRSQFPGIIAKLIIPATDRCAPIA